jgi:hypothetical protein
MHGQEQSLAANILRIPILFGQPFLISYYQSHLLTSQAREGRNPCGVWSRRGYSSGLAPLAPAGSSRDRGGA